MLYKQYSVVDLPLHTCLKSNPSVAEYLRSLCIEWYCLPPREEQLFEWKVRSGDFVLLRLTLELIPARVTTIALMRILGQHLIPRH